MWTQWSQQNQEEMPVVSGRLRLSHYHHPDLKKKYFSNCNW